MIKQVIVIRKDLKMRKGKMIAQGAHASMKVILDEMNQTHNYADFKELTIEMTIGGALDKWLLGTFTKIVVGCNSEEELLALQRKAAEECLRNALIQDIGKTEFHGQPTYTALAIGPEESSVIDSITGHLKLL